MSFHGNQHGFLQSQEPWKQNWWEIKTKVSGMMNEYGRIVFAALVGLWVQNVNCSYSEKNVHFIKQYGQ